MPWVVADAAVDDGPGMGAGGDGRAQVIADDGAADDLAEDVDHHHVALLEGFDDPGVLAAAGAAALGQAGLLDGVVVIGAVGDELGGDGPADGDAAGVGFFPVAFKLAHIALLPHHAPGLFGGGGAEALENFVGHPRPAVGKAVKRVERGHGNHIFIRRLNAHVGLQSLGRENKRRNS